MKKVTQLFLVASLVVVPAFSAPALAAPTDSRMITYTSDGDTYYAVSIVPNESVDPAGPASVAIVFDTSATQQGLYRETARAALDEMLASLDPGTQVRLYAADLDAQAMGKPFAASDKQAAARALAELDERVPLGSTDLVGSLATVAKDMGDDSDTPRSIMYIGDGMSVANMLDEETLAGTVKDLTARRVSVSSYAIGPGTDVELLAVLANHTGGNVYVAEPLVWADSAEGISDERAAEEDKRMGRVAGKRLAEWTTAAVYWPTSVALGSELGQVLPDVCPPLRSDRDTILLGLTPVTLPTEVPLGISVEVAGQAEPMMLQWTATPEASIDDHAFLAQLVDSAVFNGGIRLPTVGSAGLAESARLIGARLDQLTGLAKRAVASGDHRSAERIVQTVLRADPGNLQARTVQNVVEETAPEAADPAMIVGDEDLLGNVPPRGRLPRRGRAGKACLHRAARERGSEHRPGRPVRDEEQPAAGDPEAQAHAGGRPFGD